MSISREPVVYLNLVRALIALVVVFGLGLPVGADVAILALAEAVITIFTRSQVTPVRESGAGDLTVRPVAAPDSL